MTKINRMKELMEDIFTNQKWEELNMILASLISSDSVLEAYEEIESRLRLLYLLEACIPECKSEKNQKILKVVSDCKEILIDNLVNKRTNEKLNQYIEQEQKHIFVLCLENHEDSEIYGIYNDDMKGLFESYNKLAECYDKKKYGPDIVIYKYPINHFSGEKFMIGNQFAGDYFPNNNQFRLDKEEVKHLFMGLKV